MGGEKRQHATFWLPGEESKFQGTIEKLEDRSISIVIVGSDEHRNSFSMFKRVYPVILGRSFDGQDFSLFDCFLRHSTSNHEGNFNIQLGANLMIEGKHGNCKTDFDFSEAVFSFIGLEKWLNPLIADFIMDEGIAAEIKMPWPSEMKINCQDYDVSIRYHPRFSQGDYPSIEWNIFVAITYHNNLKFEELIKSIWHLKRFFEFAIKNNILFTSVKAKCGQEMLGLYFRNDKVDPEALELSRHDMLLPYYKISDQFGLVLNRWISLYTEKQNFLSRYMKHLYQPDTYNEELFFTAASLVEMYHNQFISDDREKYIDHFVLINSEFETLGQTLLNKAEIERIENHRHYMAHGSQGRESNLLNSTEMMIYINKIQIILCVLILKQLGLEDIARSAARSSGMIFFT